MTGPATIPERFARGDGPFCARVPLDDMARLVRRRRHRDFCDAWKALLAAWRGENVQVFMDGDADYFAELFPLWFTTLSSQSFQLEDGDESLFLLNSTAVNLLAATPHGNADACLGTLLNNRGHPAKVLLAYTPRSGMRLPVGEFFRLEPALASVWYTYVWNWADTYVDATVADNFRYFLEEANDAFMPFNADVVIPYFRCTYVDNRRDRHLKRIFMRSVSRALGGTRLRNAPNSRSVAVVSSYWNGTHAVYRAFEPYVRELAADFDLTLVNLSAKDIRPAELNGSPFARVRNVHGSGGALDISEVLDNDFQLAYYPDMGISQESLYLAALRLAPIQCMGTGHPVSSGCPEMDYFISGAEVETRDRPEDNYDERLVLLPGLSVRPVKPDYRPRRPEKAGDFIINCPWAHMKNNHAVVSALRKMYDRASRPIRFAVFPGCSSTRNGAQMATIIDYSRILPPDAFVVHPSLPYPEYLAEQERGRFTLHSYPFGGGTTAVDALHIGNPLVVWRGRHEYNRFAAAILERIGLGELVADSEEEWVALCVRLVDDAAYLADVAGRVNEADLDALLYRNDEAGDLRRAFGQLIRNDARYRGEKSREPIPVE